MVTKPVPLDGALERNSYPPLIGLVFGLVVAFLASQVITGIALVVILIISTGEAATDISSLAAHSQQVFIANSMGQIFGLALVALAFARLHSKRPLAYLRLRGTTLSALFASGFGLLALLPFVHWLAAVNESLPLPQPEWLQQAEQSSMELIETLLGTDGGILFPLLVLALTPAICEELLFRGYLQRQLERMGGAAAGIVATGILFGFFHLRLSQILPLVVLGIYLAYITWRTKSLWPAVLVHFLHNGFAIIYSRLLPTPEAMPPLEPEEMQFPFYLVMIGLLLFGVVAYYLHVSAPAWNEELRPWVKRTHKDAAFDHK